MKKHIFAISAARSPHAVSRIALVFARRRIVLDTFVLTSANEQTACIRVACSCEALATQQLLGQLQRIVEVQCVSVEAAAENSAMELPSMVS